MILRFFFLVTLTGVNRQRLKLTFHIRIIILGIFWVDIPIIALNHFQDF